MGSKQVDLLIHDNPKRAIIMFAVFGFVAVVAAAAASFDNLPCPFDCKMDLLKDMGLNLTCRPTSEFGRLDTFEYACYEEQVVEDSGVRFYDSRCDRDGVVSPALAAQQWVNDTEGDRVEVLHTMLVMGSNLTCPHNSYKLNVSGSTDNPDTIYVCCADLTPPETETSTNSTSENETTAEENSNPATSAKPETKPSANDTLEVVDKTDDKDLDEKEEEIL